MARKSKYYQRPDGLYEAIRTINGKRVAFRGKSCREVDRKILEFTGLEQRGRLFADVADEWWERHVEEISPNTVRNYSSALSRAVERFGNCSMKEITPKQLEAFLRTLAARKYASKTIAAQRLVLNLIFRHAVISGDIQINPCDCLPVIKGKAKVPRELPTDDDIKKIRASLDHPYGLLHYFVLYTGCRRGEALAVQYRDIDREAGVIHVTKSVYYSGSKPEMKLPKTSAGYRDIILLDILADKIPQGKPDDFVCLPNGPEYKTTLERHLRQYRRDTGITCTLHQLRHAYATMLYEAGIDDKAAQELLGHASIQMTRDIYTHISARKAADTALKLNTFTQNSQ